MIDGSQTALAVTGATGRAPHLGVWAAQMGGCQCSGLQASERAIGRLDFEAPEVTVK